MKDSNNYKDPNNYITFESDQMQVFYLSKEVDKLQYSGIPLMKMAGMP